MAVRLYTPNLNNLGAKSPIVSGLHLKYSRFSETRARDRARSALCGGRGSPVDVEMKRTLSYLFTGPCCSSGHRTMKPVCEQTDVSSFGAWRAVDEVRDTLERHIGQRRCEFLFRKACFEQILRSDDRSQPVANRMNGHEQMVEAVA